MNEDRFDERTIKAANILASLSPYGTEEAALIIEAIAACKPIDQIAELLICSPKSEATKP